MDVNYVDKLSLFLGKPFKVSDNVYFYSPTINEINDIGETLYMTYIKILTFNLKEIMVDLFGEEEKEIKYLNDTLDEKDRYYFLLSNVTIQELVYDALCFFSKQNKIIFDTEDCCFKYEEETLISSDLYLIISDIIREINGIAKPKPEKAPRFKNKIAEDMYYEMMKRKKELESKKNKNSGLDLKDMLSILCVFQGNGISLDNVGNFTIYQIKEQFERLTLKESHNRILPLWASGNMDEKSKVPEWMTKTKI